jgi:uncharacterized membrane-anchored protein
MAQAKTYGGLGFGTVYTSLAFLTVIIAFVTLATLSEPALKVQTLTRTRRL